MARAIKNYGIFWDRNLVNWGSRGKGNSGTLKGYYKDRKTKICDFRDQIAVYILYDKDLNAIYIGQTGSGDHRLFNRLKDHTCNDLRNRWRYFSWLGFKKVNNDGKLSEAQHPNSNVSAQTKDFLDEVESVLLQIMEPKLNKQGPRWGGAEEYLQEVDQHILENVDVMKKLQSMEKTLGTLLEAKKNG